MVTIYTDSCRAVFLFVSMENVPVGFVHRGDISIYICLCSLRLVFVHVISVKLRKNIYLDDFGDFEIEFQVGFLIFTRFLCAVSGGF